MALARGDCVATMFSGTFSRETENNCSFFVFGHWGMFSALTHGTSGLALNTQRGTMTEFVTRVALNQRCDRNVKF